MGKLAQLSGPVGLLLTAALTGTVGFLPQPAAAQSLLQQEGTLAPMQDTYSFEGEADQTLTITLTSSEFDPVLSLLDPDGEEIARNDDYASVLDSTIIITLPETGSYTVVATSFSGEGGSYAVEVHPTTEYEQVFDRAVQLFNSEDYTDSVEAFTAAIALDDSQPSVYLGRANAYLGAAYLALGENFAGPQSLEPEVRDAIATDYEQAAALLKEQGKPDLAASLEEQAQIFRLVEPEPAPLRPAEPPEEPANSQS
ncbi:PPC domain-containing protein [Romeria aff. gracilis LEGE 07310]|uniref:PPC domain-containing protein n=1 Tax=Vasconcelosia minhoensis LEGE 07310 TaxID=915328 RepID=A0A8J7DDZ8_9CYAN|nr:PPC domain-containing protein [Romeria gracilis]MBE9079328.1 PPC domain-containing protein [Romeria aff. gracilis LEGE 07310]